MRDLSASALTTAWTPDEVEALFDTARQARLHAQRVLDASAETMQRRRDAHGRYLRIMAVVRGAEPQSG